MDSKLWMVVGLGNPGRQYEDTRHNIGFMVLDALAEREGGFYWKSSNRFEAVYAKGSYAREGVVLVKPQTYMNLSGRAVQPLAHFYGVDVDRIIAIHDDVDLEPGRLKVKCGGGAGGHKGIRSMAGTLGSPAFYRVRCGVGRPDRGDVTNYVLNGFFEEELEQLKEQKDKATRAIACLITRGLKETMNRFNRGPKRPKKKPEDETENEE